MFAGTFPGFRYTRNVAWEMRRWSDPQAQQWARTLRPLETVVAARVKRWLPVLHYPMRVGEHGDTTFAFGLIWDWAGVADDPEMRSLLSDAAQRFYGKDENCPLAYEPSGEDFLSPCLAIALHANDSHRVACAVA